MCFWLTFSISHPFSSVEDAHPSSRWAWGGTSVDSTFFKSLQEECQSLNLHVRFPPKNKVLKVTNQTTDL